MKFVYFACSITKNNKETETDFSCGTRWKCGDELKCLEQVSKPQSSALGYRPMVTGPQRHSGIPRRCLFGTRLASRVGLPDNTHIFLSPTQVKWEGCWERTSGPDLRRLSLQLDLVTMEIFQIPAGRDGSVLNLQTISHKAPFKNDINNCVISW